MLLLAVNPISHWLLLPNAIGQGRRDWEPQTFPRGWPLRSNPIEMYPDETLAEHGQKGPQEKDIALGSLVTDFGQLLYLGGIFG